MTSNILCKAKHGQSANRRVYEPKSQYTPVGDTAELLEIENLSKPGPLTITSVYSI